MTLHDHASLSRLGQVCLTALLVVASPLAAQDDGQDGPEPQDSDNASASAPALAPAPAPAPNANPAQATKLPPPTIVVLGDEEAAKAERRLVTAGSRLPRKPIFVDGPIATSLGTPGLTPGSGMDPAGSYTIITTRKTCVAEDPQIGKDVACILIAAREAAELGDAGTLRGLLLPVATSPEHADAERSAAAMLLWNDAKRSGEPLREEEALLALVASGTLSPLKEMQAWQALAKLSGEMGDANTQRERLEQMASYDEVSPNGLAQLALVQREAGEDRASETMLRAIAKLTADGQSIPAGWKAFAAL